MLVDFGLRFLTVAHRMGQLFARDQTGVVQLECKVGLGIRLGVRVLSGGPCFRLWKTLHQNSKKAQPICPALDALALSRILTRTRHISLSKFNPRHWPTVFLGYANGEVVSVNV